jgi:hypothetical protein
MSCGLRMHRGSLPVVVFLQLRFRPGGAATVQIDHESYEADPSSRKQSQNSSQDDSTAGVSGLGNSVRLAFGGRIV